MTNRTDATRLLAAAAATTFTAVALCSCQTVAISELGYLQQPNMQFEGSGPFAYDCGLLGQIETGRAVSTGTATSGCSSCN